MQKIDLIIDALDDMLSGWKYIRESHGDLYGVGWDRAESKAVVALAAARELREMEPVARFNWEAAQFEWLTKYSYDKHHMTPLYVLGESND